MAETNQLKVRLVLCAKTAETWATDTTVLLKGELGIESDTRKVKIGNGTNVFKDLPYATITPEEVHSLISAASHSHSNKAILDATTASFTTALLNKLNGIEAGANKITVDSEMSTTSTNPVQNKVVKTELDAKVPNTRTVNGKALSSNITLGAGDVGAIPSSAKGAKNGVASLDANGLVPSSQLPSYVDDVLEGYIASDAKNFYKDSSKSSAYSPETGKIYVDLTNNKTYRWSGTTYVVISETLALGTTSSTAFRGDLGQTAYDHSQSAHAPSNAERNIITSIKRNGTALTPDASRAVNISVPTKTSEITNDSGFITSGANVASANKLSTARNIDGVKFDGTANISHYGTCDTVAATAAKTVSLSNYSLAIGSRVVVKFTVTNSAANPTLNVNNTGAKPIVYRGKAISAGYLGANRVYEFVYDGTNWNLMGDIDTNNIYTANTGIKLSGNTFQHTNSVTAGTASGDASKTLTYGGTFTIPSVTYDAQGHITGKGTTTMTMPAVPGNVASATKLQNARNFSITGGATAAAVRFNGTADVALNVTAVNAVKLVLNAGDSLVLDGNF
ncbi:Uncharacterised protein [uncultured Clostridium sp.]|nr:Uncharacterised protein [uncultured Clostridium sp.]